MSSVDVRRVSTTKVRPASYIDEPMDNHRRIDLYTWDLFFLRTTYMQKEFVHATADISVDDIVSSTYVPQSLIDPLFPLNGVTNYQGQSHPLISLQVTELRDGAVFIGCSANHSV
ncbi:hypothetical protein MKX01_016940 [Papaver californicum]|nr:hypothetical protein MKX01_016940 [Papaver californicum]